MSDGKDETFDPEYLDSVDVYGTAASTRIGNYRVLQRVGQGGMGVVYEAEQLEPVRRRVALKVIKLGMDTERVVARFESERQALALMNHPNIARVFDAGVTSEGRPFFAMEFVHGVPITEYCDRNQLDTRDRLGLFIQVCEGVQHAHQKGVIHRDIKPSNVIVCDQDQHRIPKIIDFGVAKATAQRLTDKTFFTEMGQFVGTPEYMSPEQAEMAGMDIDTRTDVYLLGVLLYQLLTGRLPFDPRNSGQTRRTGFDELRRQVLEEEPERPSSRITQLGPSTEVTARNHSSDPRSLARGLRGDLDWITMKALEKDRTRRYASASEFAADVRRYLEYEPVMAGPPSKRYRLSKFVRRNRTGVAFAAVLFAVVAAFAVTLGLQARRLALALEFAQSESERANQETVASREVANFLVSLFGVADPNEALGNSITAREILDEGSRKIETELGGQQAVQGRLMATMGEVYASLGLVDKARELLEDALRIQRTVPRTNYLELAKTMDVYAGILVNPIGDYRLARENYEQALSIREAALGDDDPRVASSMNNLANLLVLMGDEPGRAAELYEQAFRVWEKTLGPDDPTLATQLTNRAYPLWRKANDYDAARPLLERALAILRRAHDGDRHPAVARALQNLGTLSEADGDLEQAGRHHRDALSIRESIYEPNHPEIAASMVALARLAAREQNADAAERAYRRAVEIWQSTAGLDNPTVLYDRATYHAWSGETDEALALLRRAVVAGGFANAALLSTDPNLEPLRDEPSFDEIVAAARRERGRRP